MFRAKSSSCIAFYMPFRKAFMNLEGNILCEDEIVSAKIEFGKKIKTITKTGKKNKRFILPGFIDAHIHLESTMLSPRRFAEAAIPHGTTTIITDPHEIANVLGMQGIRFIMKKSHPLKIFITAPSCVPATPFETSGARLGIKEVKEILGWKRCVALGEMMNYPGVIAGDHVVWGKIRAARKARKPIDGHAPLVSGEDLVKYVGAGISTDHECATFEEAQEKSSFGMTIMVREGSASHNMESLIGIQGKKFLVSDDLHPGDLHRGHVDALLRKAVSLGCDPVEAVRMVTEYPASHYNLSCGKIEEGYDADLVVVDNLQEFHTSSVFINGREMAHAMHPLFKTRRVKVKSSFHVAEKVPEDFVIPSSEEKETVKVIRIIENQIVTEADVAELRCANGEIIPDPLRDILFLFVVDRHKGKNVGKGFVTGIGLKDGALASSVAHDSHNIVVAGTSKEHVCRAVNAVVRMKGGLVCVTRKKIFALPLPMAGLMSDEPASRVARENEGIQNAARTAGAEIPSPFMTLSFLSLLVVPRLKLSDRGLFDVERFHFCPLVGAFDR